MRCYFVDEVVHKGIPLSLVDDTLCIDVGEELVMLDEAFSNVLRSAKENVVSRLQECLETGICMRKPLLDSELFHLERIYDYVKDEGVRLLYADVDAGTPHMDIVRESAKSPDALVLLETAAGEGGKIEFMCNTFYEYFDLGMKRVERIYSREFPPAGVTVIRQGKTPQGTDCYLLRMAPSSTVRIERSGDLDTAPRVLTLSWKARRRLRGDEPLVLVAHG